MGMKQIKRNIMIMFAFILIAGSLWTNNLTTLANGTKVPAADVIWNKANDIKISVKTVPVPEGSEVTGEFLNMSLYHESNMKTSIAYRFWDMKKYTKDWILYYDDYEGNWDFSEYINESGTYKLEVTHTVSVSGSDAYDGLNSFSNGSGEYEYVRPDEELNAVHVWWEEDGTLNWSVVKEDYAKQYVMYLYYDGMYARAIYFDNDYIMDGIAVDYFNTEIYKAVMSQPGTYTLKVRVLSSDVDQVANSVLSDAGSYTIFEDGSIMYEDNSPEEDKVNNVENVTYTATWLPVTEEELERYSYSVSTMVSVLMTKSSDFEVVQVGGSVQGRKFFDAIEMILGDYTIGGTLNVILDYQFLYNLANPVTITIEIPEYMRAEGRIFSMAGVDEAGVPYMQEDLDSDPDTITFIVQEGYAFALCHIDVK